MRDNPEIPPKTKWVEEVNFHFTLKFFGEISEAQVLVLENALEAAVGDKKKFDITLRSIGAFPAPTHPRIIWVGVAEGAEKLSALAEDIEKETVSAGLPATDKPFSPHLTLARLNHTARPGLPKVLEKHQDAAFGSMTVDHLSLIQSVLNVMGPQYTEIKRWSLK